MTEFKGKQFDFEIIVSDNECYPSNILLWSCKKSKLRFANEINLLKFSPEDFKLFIDNIEKKQSCQFQTCIWDDEKNIPLIFVYFSDKNEFVYL